MKYILLLALFLTLTACKESPKPYNIKDEIIVNQIQNELKNDSIQFDIFTSENELNRTNWYSWHENLKRKISSNPKWVGFAFLHNYLETDSVYSNNFDSLSVEFISNRGYKLNDSCAVFFGNAKFNKRVENHVSAKVENTIDNGNACIKCESGPLTYLYLIYNYSENEAIIYDSIPFNGGIKGFGF